MRSKDIFQSGYDQQKIIGEIRAKKRPLKTVADLEPLLARIGNARVVMLGEASHGTHEYYTWRSQISRRLIEEMGFDFIAVEGDWPDCYRINRYVKGYIQEANAREVLRHFERWPTWMWANWEMVAWAEWLRAYNKNKKLQARVGFFGLDVYSLWESMASILDYLKKIDPQAYELAQQAARCFEPYMGDDGRDYAFAVRLVPELCESKVLDLLLEIQRRLPRYNHDYENAFSTEQNALIAVNAERYYRSMLQGGGASWNLRDSHMQETLERLLDFHGPESKAIVWAHNTHIGDASATDMADAGMYNIGQLARQRWGRENVVLVGFGSFEGSVVAGGEWGAPMEVMPIPKAIQGSWEWMLHEAGPEGKLLLMQDFKASRLLQQKIGHRAIGVVYRPEYEFGNYVPSELPKRYDAFLYLDQSQALHPLHIQPHGGQIPETYPFGV